MNDLHELSNPWESFKQGQPEAFRYYFHLHNYRIYCYLLRLTRDSIQAKELTENAFIVLFRNKEALVDAEHLLRRLYLSARVGFLLRLKGQRSSAELEGGLCYFFQEEADIMDDLEIARNETLIALQAAMQKLPPAKREVAELYFFQGLSLGGIARQLGLDEQSVKETISESLKWLGKELPGKRPDDQKNFLVVRA